MKSAGLVLALAALSMLAACDRAATSLPVTHADPYQPAPYVKITHPEWSRSATIYQINLRQFTQAGTFAAAQEQLPRLKTLGADILWLMPIHPIGRKNRKGTLGSPYAVLDYYGVNPEFGTLEDMKGFVTRAHELGLYVILDWVANHTAWDNPLVTRHPDWYLRDWKGNFHPTSWWDWSDIIELDFDEPGVRRYMTGAMKYWVAEANIDGYRCDTAGYVPLDFWNNVRRELDLIKPVFMLAEAESTDMHAQAFDATYAWSWHSAMHQIAQGHAGPGALQGYYSANDNAWPRDAMRMTFVTNHDKNAWEGTELELFGEALAAAIVLSVVSEGIPLIYNGQEAGNTRRLKFFEKDPIAWKEHANGALYRKLFALKERNTALWNGKWGARMIPVLNDKPQSVFSFVRQNDRDKVFAAFNLSKEPASVRFRETLFEGTYTEYFGGDSVTLSQSTELKLEPWSYRVFVR